MLGGGAEIAVLGFDCVCTYRYMLLRPHIKGHSRTSYDLGRTVDTVSTQLIRLDDLDRGLSE